mmetsp:Transcript_7520/g.12107  ORF Transcript_7520/g.12107 Transcript_7520/m.12107 type:complete len:466 (-) Transcript_7520:1455-2852(-)
MVEWEGCTRCRSTGRCKGNVSAGRRKVYKKRVREAMETGMEIPEMPCVKVKCKQCQGFGVVAHGGTSMFKAVYEPEVVIVGGGIGGCALSLALSHRNIKSSVFEKDPSFDSRAQGYGLTMQQAATTLRRLGFRNLHDFGIASTHHTSLLSDGTVLSEYGRMVHSTTKDRGGNGRGSNQRFNIQLPRQRLRQMLFDALVPGTVRWGHCFEKHEYCKSSGKYKVYFRVESSPDLFVVECDLLVGADGIWSRVRRQRIGLEPPRYLGVIVILGRARCTHELADNKVFQTLGGETRIYAMPFEEGVTMWQLSFPVTLEEANLLSKSGSAGLLAESLRRCEKWHAPIGELLKDTKAEDVTGYPAFDRPPPEVFGGTGRIRVAGELDGENIVLIGDAIHPMSPFKGQGANQVLIDALSLAETLASCPNSPLALFETEMTKRVRSKVEGSAEAAVVLHTQQGVDLRASRLKT